MEQTQEAILQAALRASLEDLTGGTSAGPACGGAPLADETAWDLKVSASNQGLLPAGMESIRVAHPGSGAGGDAPGGSPPANPLSVDHARGAAAAEGAESEAVRMLLAMGFSLPRAVQAHAQFGDDVDSMLAYLLDQ